MNEHAGILLVDDNRDEVDVAIRALNRAGVDVPIEVARDGLAALESLGLESEAPDRKKTPRVIFLDLRMPRVDGFEVLRRVREDPLTEGIPVVVLSSSNRKEDIQRSYALGANSYLLKRFDGDKPGSYIVAAAHYWLNLNRTVQEGG